MITEPKTSKVDWTPSGSTSTPAITAGTGLGKGSLYHLFPGGKAEMAAAVLAEIDAWFEAAVFAPLRDRPDTRQGPEAGWLNGVSER